MYHCLQSFLFTVTLLLLSSNVSRALDCKLNNADPLKVAYTLTVSRSGRGKFKKIQEAIDSIPVNNDQWIRIQLSPEIYQEKVIIPNNKPCIFLEGAGSKRTKIQWDDHNSTSSSPTFTNYAENFVAKGIMFQNTYNVPARYQNNNPLKPAAAARISGDKSAFYECNFRGLQDTLFDDIGRHYFHSCYIEGAVDFIFGNGQSIYEKCVVKATLKEFGRTGGYITAQARDSENEPTGFLFRRCAFVGTGKAYLGRAYRGHSRVYIVNSQLTDIIESMGWSAWNYRDSVQNIDYAEADCTGAGADTSKRVPWEKKLSSDQLRACMNNSFIDQEGWLAKLPAQLGP